MQGHRHRLKKGEVFQSTDGRKLLNLVDSGYAKRYMISSKGELSVQVVYGPGDVFPITLVYKLLFGQNLYEGPEVFYYEAVSPMLVYTAPGEDIIKAAQADPRIYKPLLQESANRLHSTLNGLENIGLPSAYHRVAHQLVYLAEQFGRSLPGDRVRIPIPLTHQDLADILSLTRETVSIAMGKLKSEKLIDYRTKYITISSLPNLQEVAYSPSESS